MSDRIKYPRTLHAPWSEGVQSDDKTHGEMNHFDGKEVVVTEKMDGENTTMTREYFHARSVDSRHHPSRDYVKAKWGEIRYLIPDGWRVCGENLYAKHSIEYENLEDYFMVFSIWNEKNEKIPFDEMLEWCKELNLSPVRLMWRGIYDEGKIKSLLSEKDYESKEGYVIQLADKFSYSDFGKYTAKFVRPKHVQTTKHWMKQKITPNKLKI